MKEVCKQTLQRAYLILDGEEISVEERTRIETHLEECSPCYERYGVEVEVKRVIQRLRGSCACPDRLREKITSLLEES
ncbi:MAG: mycothiol system anti-sigma-R factor [Actinomycetota bacterium]